jgi:hypothetical protein
VTDCRYGFRILGPTSGERRLVDWNLAFCGYAGCDPRAEVGREAYLSAFTLGREFKDHLEETGGTKGYNGPCWAPFIWWDIDREDDLQAALNDARALAANLADRYRLDGDDLLIF